MANLSDFGFSFCCHRNLRWLGRLGEGNRWGWIGGPKQNQIAVIHSGTSQCNGVTVVHNSVILNCEEWEQ